MPETADDAEQELTGQTVRSGGIAVSGQQFKHLSERIQQNHEKRLKAEEYALEYARRCGQYLHEVKALLPHGEFLPWVDGNTTFGRRTAQHYMRIYLRWGNLQELTNGEPVGINEAAQLLSHKANGKSSQTVTGQAVRSDSEPLPCPFCGSRDVEFAYPSMKCQKCMASGPPTLTKGPIKGESTALSKWNRRIRTNNRTGCPVERNER